MRRYLYQIAGKAAHGKLLPRFKTIASLEKSETFHIGHKTAARRIGETGREESAPAILRLTNAREILLYSAIVPSSTASGLYAGAGSMPTILVNPVNQQSQ
jgi:hypothetical protein